MQCASRNWIHRYEKEWNEYIEEAQKVTPHPSSPIQPCTPFPALASEMFNHPTYGTLQPCLVSSSLPSLEYKTMAHPHALRRPGPPLIAPRSMHPFHLGPLYRPSSFLEVHFRHALASFPLRRAVTLLWSNADVREKGEYGGSKGDILTGQDFDVEWVKARHLKGGFWSEEGLDAQSPGGVGEGQCDFKTTRNDVGLGRPRGIGTIR
jgi:hypothetical protein